MQVLDAKKEKITKINKLSIILPVAYLLDLYCRVFKVELGYYKFPLIPSHKSAFILDLASSSLQGMRWEFISTFSTSSTICMDTLSLAIMIWTSVWLNLPYHPSSWGDSLNWTLIIMVGRLVLMALTIFGKAMIANGMNQQQ